MPTPPRPTGRPAPTRAPAHIPRFTLYGEAGGGDAVELLHVEAIERRSRLYHVGDRRPPARRSPPVAVAASRQRRGPPGRQPQPGGGPGGWWPSPPGVVHAFRFEPECDGHVLTLATPALVEGDPALSPDALQALFGQALALTLDAGDEATQRLDGLFHQLQQRSPGARAGRRRPGAAVAGARRGVARRAGRGAAHAAPALRPMAAARARRRCTRASWRWWKRITSNTGRCSATRSGWAPAPTASTA
jgi:AraC family transcriptional activator of pobA